MAKRPFGQTFISQSSYAKHTASKVTVYHMLAFACQTITRTNFKLIWVQYTWHIILNINYHKHKEFVTNSTDFQLTVQQLARLILFGSKIMNSFMYANYFTMFSRNWYIRENRFQGRSAFGKTSFG